MTVENQEASAELLYRMLKDMIQEAALPGFFKEQKTRCLYGKAEYRRPVDGILTERSAIYDIHGRDIYGQEKPTEARYVDCPECMRQIAGQRFASHISRCLSKRR